MAGWKFSIPRPGIPFGSAWRGRRHASYLGKSVDLYVAAAMTIAASSVAALMPTDNPLRALTVVCFLLLVPGYLFLQALIVQKHPHIFEPAHALFAVGISPAVVGLLALSTTLAPVGFRLSTVFAVVVTACVLLAVIAFARRLTRLRASHQGTVKPPG